MNLLPGRRYGWSLLLLLLTGSGLPAAQTLNAWSQSVPAGLGGSVDIAPWGERNSWAEGKDIGLLWEDPRDITRVVVRFAGTPPDPATVRLQWWQSQWPERRMPRDRLSGAGESGWLDIGDWYRGSWRDADVARDVSGKTWTYRFRPVNAKEFPNLRDFTAEYRTTMKLRLLFETAAPRIETLQVFSD